MMALLASADTGMTNAKSSSLYNVNTKTFLYRDNSEIKLPMASTTKIVTALIAIETLDPDEIIKVPKDATGIEGSSIYLKEGDKISVSDLIYSVLLQSANDAATVLALRISGDVDSFADKMNERVSSLGLSNTHFENPHGLDSSQHYTTAYDLALIASEALNNEQFRKITSTYKHTFKIGDETRTIVNHNKLIKLYDGCIGVKTGFTKKCGRCLVGAAERDGLSFITVTIDAPSDWNDHALMLDFGYDTLEKVMLADVGEYSYELGVVGGKDEKITVTNTTSLSYIKDRNKGVIDRHVRLVQFAEAPVTPSDTLGEVIFTLDGREIGRISLYPCECVEKAKSEGLLKKLKSIFDG
jgi:D-alanyl-D-alanine carboxypeptidase